MSLYAYEWLQPGSPQQVYDEDILGKESFEHLLCDNQKALEFRYCRLKDGIWKDISPGEIQIDELKLDYSDLRGKIGSLPAFIVDAEVRKLSLINTKLRAIDLQTFYTELKATKGKKTKLDSLNLKYVEIDADGCKILARILNLLPVVEELIITNCDLNSDGIKNFYETISDGKIIRNLYLGENDRIEPEGMFFVGKIAEKCKVENMQLTSCDLGDEELERISETFPDNIKTLDLSDNMGLLASEIINLGTKWTSLEEIDVRECCFDREEEAILRRHPGCKIIFTEGNALVESEDTSLGGLTTWITDGILPTEQTSRHSRVRRGGSVILTVPKRQA